MKPLAEQNFYELLEVAPTARPEEIEVAFSRAMAYYGPDSVAIYSLVSAEEAKATAQRLEDAYLTLSDAGARRAYDLEHGFAPPEPKPEPVREAPAPTSPTRPSSTWLGSGAFDEEDDGPAAPGPPPGARPVVAVATQLLSQVPAPEPERAPSAEMPRASESAPVEGVAPTPEPAPVEPADPPALAPAPVPAEAAPAAPALPTPPAAMEAPTAPAEEPPLAPPEPVAMAPVELPVAPPRAAAIDAPELPAVFEKPTPPPAVPELLPIAAPPAQVAVPPAVATPAVEPAPRSEEPRSEPVLSAEPIEPLPTPVAIVRAPLPRREPLPPQPTPLPATPGSGSKPPSKAFEVPPDAVFSGELLRRLRESRGLGLREVSDRTKIGYAHLENIEADHYKALPVTVYLRGFLMSLARELKLDPLKVSKSYLDLVAKAKQKG